MGGSINAVSGLKLNQPSRVDFNPSGTVGSTGAVKNFSVIINGTCES